MAEAKTTVLTLKKQDLLTPNEILDKVWRNPNNHEAIINAKPLEEYEPEHQEPTSEQEPSSKSKPSKKDEPLPKAAHPRSGSFKGGEDDKQLLPSTPPDFSKLPEGNIELVPEEDLTKPPYCSIGKLFWLNKNRLNPKRMYWSTAYYIGDNRLITAAHTFETQDFLQALRVKRYDLEAAIFVPAMKTKYDIFGEKYGYFAVEMPAEKHRDYTFTPETKHLDIAICRTEEGRKCSRSTSCQRTLDELESIKAKNLQEFENLFEEISTLDEVNISPIQCSAVEPAVGTVCTVVGYGKAPVGGEDDDGSDGGRMTRVSGRKIDQTVLEKYYERNEQPQQLNKLTALDVVIREGMSGGPWLLQQSSLANGCQGSTINEEIRRKWVKKFRERCENVDQDFAYFSLSTRFTEQLFSELGIENIL